MSLTSSVVVEHGRPVPAEALARQVLPLIEGEPIDELPEGVLGRAAIVTTTPPAIASRALSGMLVTEGRLLLVTITSEDMTWARRVWTSIAFVPAQGARRVASAGLDTDPALHEIRVVKNVTVTLDEETARWARVEAARREVSVSRLIRETLEARMRGQESYEASKHRYLSRPGRRLKRAGGYPLREGLHERASLR